MSEASGSEPTSDVRDQTGQPEPLHPQPPTPTTEQAGGKKRSDLTLRLITAVVLVPLVIYIIAIGGYAYLFTVLVFGLIAQYEFYRMIESKGARPLMLWGLGFGAAVITVAYVGTEYSAMLLMTASLLVMMVAQLRKARISQSLASISGTFFGVFYVAWLISHAILLRNFDHAVGKQYPQIDLSSLGLVPETGIFLMIFTLGAVIGCDAGAYFAGRAWGRRKLAPEISPNKSVEGALGGVATGIGFAFLIKLVFDFVWPTMSEVLPWSLVGPFALVLCVVGIIGDLVESLLKRDADVKDTGGLLPGMGGVLDRIDAPLLAFPVMYYMLLAYVFFSVG